MVPDQVLGVADVNGLGREEGGRAKEGVQVALDPLNDVAQVSNDLRMERVSVEGEDSITTLTSPGRELTSDIPSTPLAASCWR